MTQDISERLRTILYRGSEILFADYSGLSGEKMLSQIRQNRTDLLKLGETKEGKSLLIVSDFRNTELDSDILWALKELATVMDPHVKASAVLGFSDMRRFSLNVLNTLVSVKRMAFATRDEALAWLVSQSGK